MGDAGAPLPSQFVLADTEIALENPCEIDQYPSRVDPAGTANDIFGTVIPAVMLDIRASWRWMKITDAVGLKNVY